MKQDSNVPQSLRDRRRWLGWISFLDLVASADFVSESVSSQLLRSSTGSPSSFANTALLIEQPIVRPIVSLFFFKVIGWHFKLIFSRCNLILKIISVCQKMFWKPSPEEGKQQSLLCVDNVAISFAQWTNLASVFKLVFCVYPLLDIYFLRRGFCSKITQI